MSNVSTSYKRLFGLHTLYQHQSCVTKTSLNGILILPLGTISSIPPNSISLSSLCTAGRSTQTKGSISNRVNRKWPFCIIGQWFSSNSRLNRLYKRKYKFVRVKAYKRGKASFPVDVHRSKTSLLKLPKIEGEGAAVHKLYVVMIK